MENNSTWNKIIVELSDNSKEMPTVPCTNREPLWFIAFIENENLYVNNAINHNPSTKMAHRRKITNRDFNTVYSYYHSWANGERHLRQEVRLLSRNTAYIFALIAYFE